MHCPTCNKTLAAGTKCPKCGKMAVASSADEIDLMPLEPAKAPDPSAFHPPPDLPPPVMPGKTGSSTKTKATDPAAPPPDGKEMDEPIRPRAGAMVTAGGNTNKIIGGAVVLIIVLFFAWRILRTEDKITGKLPFENKQLSIAPNSAYLENYEVTGKIKWTFDVTPLDDTISIGVVTRNPSDPKTIVALKKLNETYETVAKGQAHPMSGEFKTGKYSWVVLNETKKSVRVKVTFKAQP